MMLLLAIIVLSGIALVVVPFLWESFFGPVLAWFDNRNINLFKVVAYTSIVALMVVGIAATVGGN